MFLLPLPVPVVNVVNIVNIVNIVNVNYNPHSSLSPLFRPSLLLPPSRPRVGPLDGRHSGWCERESASRHGVVMESTSGIKEASE